MAVDPFLSMLAQEDARLQLLAEVGFMAAAMGLFPKAVSIFGGLRAVRPESEHPILGLAVSHLNRGDFRTAARLLYEDGLRANPQSDLVKAMLALALNMGGRITESEKLFEEVVQSGREPAAVKMAKNMLKPKPGREPLSQTPSSTPPTP